MTGFASAQALGALVGLLAALGVLLALSRVPALRRPSLDDRVAPYLRESPHPSRLLRQDRTMTPFPTLERIVGPLVIAAARRLEGVLGGGASVRRRLERAGGTGSLEQFRAEQVLCGMFGLLSALTLGVLTLSRGVGRPAPLLILCLVTAVAGVVGRDQWLSRAVSRREQRMMAEFPTVAELLALAVAAGEGAAGALERVARRSNGELALELGRTLADARSGTSLVIALQGVADRTALPALARFADGIAIAIERGTPLADVLRAQAVDVREAGRRDLLEIGGRKEIAMMIPVIFLVLPVTVLFALFPGFVGLSLAA